MKKLLTTTFAAALGITLVSCGKTETAEAPAPAVEKPAATEVEAAVADATKAVESAAAEATDAADAAAADASKAADNALGALGKAVASAEVNAKLDVACAACVYEVPGYSGCASIAVSYGGKAVVVEGVKVDAHGMGLCAKKMPATVVGKVEGGKIIATAVNFEK